MAQIGTRFCKMLLGPLIVSRKVAGKQIGELRELLGELDFLEQHMTIEAMTKFVEEAGNDTHLARADCNDQWGGSPYPH